VSFKRIDADTFDQVIKKGGKAVATAREVFSKDGKTFTRTTKAKDEKGQQVIVDIGVYDKQ
jgi:hypothetical protein